MSGEGLIVAIQALMLASQPAKQKAFNPNPPGQIMDGSTTDKTLAALLAVHPRYVPQATLVTVTRAPCKSVNWALYYLRCQGLVEIRNAHDKRSPLYQEYRATTKAMETCK